MCYGRRQVERWQKQRGFDPMTTPKSEVQELKPCPFCGGEAEYRNQYVQCKQCGAGFGDDKEVGDSVTLWNTRASRLLPEEVREKLLADIEVQIQACAVSVITEGNVIEERNRRKQGLERLRSLLSDKGGE